MLDPATYDWTRFNLTFYYNAHITRVFRVWTQAAGLESFFVERCVFTNSRDEAREADEAPAVGDKYHWQFRQDVSVEGEVLVYEEKKQFVFTFGEMQVELLFDVLDNQTEVQLIQTRIPETDSGRVFGHLNCRSCWTFFMTNLGSVLHHGKDLRDDNPLLVSSMEVGYVPMTQRNKHQEGV